MTCPEDLVAHMRRVLVAERDLHDLGMVWRLIESSAAISCPAEAATILPTLIDTRERFDQLQQRLTEQMADETQAELADELAAKAQCAIDILVRNLFERTADVGFLATDEVVARFCAADAAQRTADAPAMRERLAEYQRKYSVYDDVLLCAPDGTLLIRLDDGSADAEATVHPALQRSREPLVAQALAAAGFCERFGASDLAAAGQSAALLYGHRIADAAGRPVGVLLLRFRFDDEMARIFADVGGERPQIALMLVDAQQRVIASSDVTHVPLGVRLALASPGAPAGMQLTQFAGRDYLSLQCLGTPYQGYPGPTGWRAVAMVSLLTAFASRRDATEGNPATDAVAATGSALAGIRDDADAINRELRRVVWNGRLLARTQQGDRLRLTAVLRQVSAAGIRTQARVDQAIHEIGGTGLARGRQRAHDMARLAADILDRNLYERANDCRWWALSPLLRAALADEAASANPAPLNALLRHINGLYTVYSRLVVFDRHGRICGASAGPQGDDPGDVLIGTSVSAAMRSAVEALSGSELYAVTGFDDSDWHAGGPTYTYLAAVRDPVDSHRVVGGIAIVFNAVRELQAMLSDILAGRDGFAAFVDPHGRVLSVAGDAPPELISQAGSATAPVDHDGQRYLLARMAAGGYREFRTSDGHDDGVAAVVGLRLGASERRDGGIGQAELRASHPVASAQAEELAMFRVGSACYALPAQHVLEAATSRGLVRTPGVGAAGLGLLEVALPGGSALVQVLCARQLLGVPGPARAVDGTVLVLRAQHANGAPLHVGLRVDEVVSVLELDPSRYHPAPDGFQGFAPWITGLAECQRDGDGEPQLVQRLDLAALLQAGGMRVASTEPQGLAAELPVAEVV